MNAPGPGTRVFVEWTLRRGLVLWIVALVLAVPAAVRTATLYLNLDSDFEGLLPRSAPSVRALDELRARMPGVRHLGVVVDAGTAARLPAAERFVDDLAARLRTYPERLVQHVRVGDAVEREFIEKHAPLYVDLQDLTAIRERIEKRRDYEVTRRMDLAIDDEPPPSLDFGDLQKKYEQRLSGAPTRNERGRFSNVQLHSTLLLVELGSAKVRTTQAHELLGRVRADITALGGLDRYAPGMRLGYAGDVAITVEEAEALSADLLESAVLVGFAVVCALILYYRWWQSVVVLVAPLLVAAVYAFALASLPPFGITRLNANTAFLGSIILGNGVNFGIILLARYLEERRRGATVSESLVTASWGARAGTLAAALAAGTSYAALSVTEFQGFRQFGVIGGLGMVLSWLCAQVLMPPLIGWLDRGATFDAHPGPQRSAMAMIVSAVVRAPALIVAVSVVLTFGAVLRVRAWTPDSVEFDFAKLRRADTWTRGEGYWGRKMDGILGAYLTPAVILTDTPDQMRRVAARLRQTLGEPPLHGLLSSLRTADDVLPPDQEQKLEEARAIQRVLTPRIRAQLGDAERRAVERFLGRGELRVIRVEDLPPGLTTGLRERDGRIDRAVLAFPKPARALWEGRSIERLTDGLRAVAADTGGSPGRVASPLAVSSDILRRVRHDGPLASITAFVGAAATVLVVFRWSGTLLLALGSLVVGVLWLAAATMVLGVRINFANFIAFPITFGIGVDYSVNLLTRYVQDGSRNVRAAIRSTGGAVGLCSLTTILGYSSLLLAENRALFLFGVVAVLGEITCLTAAIVTVPALLEWWHRRQSGSRGQLHPAAGE